MLLTLDKFLLRFIFNKLNIRDIVKLKQLSKKYKKFINKLRIKFTRTTCQSTYSYGGVEVCMYIPIGQIIRIDYDDKTYTSIYNLTKQLTRWYYKEEVFFSKTNKEWIVMRLPTLDDITIDGDTPSICGGCSQKSPGYFNIVMKSNCTCDEHASIVFPFEDKPFEDDYPEWF
jgi:ribosome-associated translation inhibitor RaiA